jgi:hypothetical protein
MSKRAIRTSRKRVEAILRKREGEIRSETRRDSDAYWRNRLELMIPPTEERDVWLQPPPERPRIILAFANNVPVSFDPRSSEGWRFSQMASFHEVMFEAKQRMWRHSNGTVVRWVDWEPRV